MRTTRPAMTTIIRLTALPVLIFAGCSPDREAQIREVLDRQVIAWNNGDIPGFMEGYWKSDELVFEAPNAVTTGWQSTLERYLQRYPTREKMGRLQFTDLVIRRGGRDAAQVSGRWSVQTVTGDSGGGFTLDMRRIGGQWVIVRDRTTSDGG